MTRDNSISKLDFIPKNDLRQTQTGKHFQSASKDQQQLLSERGNLLSNDEEF